MQNLTAADEPHTQTALTDLADDYFFTGEGWKSAFVRMRSEGPLHYQAESRYGPFWNVVSHALVPEVLTRPDIFTTSYEYGGIGIMDCDGPQGFVGLDGPRHKEQRKAITPAFEPSELRAMADSIRQRTANVLDSLPIGEEFDWVERVAIEITTQMLARLVDFEPWEDRRKLTAWSEWTVNTAAALDPELKGIRERALNEMSQYFSAALDEKMNRSPEADLISRFAHSPTLSALSWEERLGNLALLIVGGNDTTRHSMSGMVVAFDRYPDEWTKIQRNPELIDNAVMEIIRWQTPLPNLRQTCLQDFELAGHTIRKGDKIVTWYASANRDEAVFEDAERYLADRENSRDHFSFGMGVHRCVGARLAQLQIKILIEEMLKRNMTIEVTGPASYINYLGVNGYTSLPVRARVA